MQAEAPPANGGSNAPIGGWGTGTVAAVIAALMVLGVAAGCGSTGRATPDVDGAATGVVLGGAVRNPPLAVGDVTFREVRPASRLAMAPDEPFRTRAAPGELLLMYFGYTFCPDVCPTTLTDLSAALDQLGDDASKVTLAMVTIDPDRDDLDTLAAYLGHFSERFVAVRPHDVAELRAAESAYLASSSVVRTASGDVEVSHSATVYLVDELGEVRVEWPFGTTPDTVAHDLRAVLQDIEGKNRS